MLFKRTLEKHGLGANLTNLHVSDEPHKRYNRATGKREMHKHAVFKMATPFAHVRLAKALAAHGVFGHFSFNLVGYAEYLKYCMVSSAGESGSDLDLELWSWPPRLAVCTTQTLL